MKNIIKKAVISNYLYNILTGLILELIIYWPGPFGYKIRYIYYKHKLKLLGKNVKIDTGVYFQNPGYISISDNCWIDRNVVILAGPDHSDREKIIRKNKKYPGEKGEVFIGENVHISIGCILSGISAGIYISKNCGISAGSKIYAFNSHYRSERKPSDRKYCFGPMVPHERQAIVEGPIFLDENVGVALNCIILPGVTVGKDSFITINSVLKKDIDENIVYTHSYKGLNKKYRFFQDLF